jgi:hypothetical protein
MNDATQITTHETADRPLTLTAIAAAAGVQKRAAQNWLSRAKVDHGELGEIIDNTRHFSEDERDILTSYAAPPRPAKIEAEPPRTRQIEAFPDFAAPPEPRSVDIVAGNHRLTLDGPEMGGQISLARFRGDIEVRRYQDPVSEAAGAMALFDALETAMDDDLDQSFEQLESTASTVQMLQAKAESMAAKQLEYQVTQKILARLQNQKTSELSSLLGKAQALADGAGPGL